MFLVNVFLANITIYLNDMNNVSTYKYDHLQEFNKFTELHNKRYSNIMEFYDRYQNIIPCSLEVYNYRIERNKNNNIIIMYNIMQSIQISRPYNMTRTTRTIPNTTRTSTTNRKKQKSIRSRRSRRSRKNLPHVMAWTRAKQQYREAKKKYKEAEKLLQPKRGYLMNKFNGIFTSPSVRV